MCARTIRRIKGQKTEETHANDTLSLFSTSPRKHTHNAPHTQNPIPSPLSLSSGGYHLLFSFILMSLSLSLHSTHNSSAIDERTDGHRCGRGRGRGSPVERKKDSLIARRRIGCGVIVGRGEEGSAGNIGLFSTSFFLFSPFRLTFPFRDDFVYLPFQSSEFSQASPTSATSTTPR